MKNQGGATRRLFIDQSGQPGGAELCLLDIVRHLALHSSPDPHPPERGHPACSSRHPAGVPPQVLLFEDGPFARMVEEAGISVQVLSLPESGRRVSKGGGLFSLVRSILPLVRFVARLRRIVAGFDQVYLNTPKALVLGGLACIFARVPYIFHLHDIIDAGHFSGMNRRLLVFLANRARVVIANSNASVEAYQAAGGKARWVVIYNGFEPAAFADRPAADLQSFRREFSVPADAFVAGIFGRITPWKGQSVLIEAAGRLPDLHVWIVGEALFTDEDKAYARELRAQVAGSGLETRVHFLGFRNDVAALMQAVDVVVHCSVAPEPFGRVIVEGQLSGRPVIATDAGGAREIIDHGRTGLLVPPGDVELLGEALNSLRNDPEQREALAGEARRSAIDRFSLDRVLEQIHTALVEATPVEAALSGGRAANGRKRGAL